MNTRYIYCIAAIALFTGLFNPAYAEDSPASPVFFAHLLGGNEVGPAGDANAGDQEGLGSATVITKNKGTICFAILVNNIGIPSAAHIHKSVAGQNGPIVVPLAAPKNGSPGSSSGCVKSLDPALLADIKNNPSAYYINVHSDEFPGGALRGQLF